MPRTSASDAPRALGVVAAALLLAGCHHQEAATPSPAKPTPIAAYDGTFTAAKRISICSRIPDGAILDAVGAKVQTAHYGNGQKLPGADDISHEYGCVFNGEGGLVARSWTFVPPVTPEQATAYAGAARATPGCRPLPEAKFGSISAGTVCAVPGSATVTWRGLFGEAWLGCSVAGPVGAPPQTEEALVERAGIWCVRVVETAAD